jgi:hypothetical protein
MKFSCRCGEVIRDNTDYQDNKAYLIPDETYESALEQIESGKSPWDALRRVERVMYQCHSCARLFIDDHKREFVCFAPEGDVAFGILKGAAPDA